MTVYRISLSDTFLWINIYVKRGTELKKAQKKPHILLDNNNKDVCVATVGLTESGVEKCKKTKIYFGPVVFIASPV